MRKEGYIEYNMEKMSNAQMIRLAEKIKLHEGGVRHDSYIDKKLLEKIIGCKFISKKDKNQRVEYSR